MLCVLHLNRYSWRVRPDLSVPLRHKMQEQSSTNIPFARWGNLPTRIRNSCQRLHCRGPWLGAALGPTMFKSRIARPNSVTTLLIHLTCTSKKMIADIYMVLSQGSINPDLCKNLVGTPFRDRKRHLRFFHIDCKRSLNLTYTMKTLLFMIEIVDS
jgi:hypothetical protein